MGPKSSFTSCDFMSFSFRFKTLRSQNSYDSRTQIKMSANGDEITGEAEMGMIEYSEENDIRFFQN